MKIKTFAVLPFLILISAGMSRGQDSPSRLGGFILGTDISQYQNRIQATTVLPIRHQEYLQEVEIKPDRYFKSGLITYGNCDKPGKIIRIRLKYEDSGREMYEQLLSRFKTRFGEPVEWRGDPFQAVLAWKWSFKDKESNNVTLILQHNSKDREQKLGNSVKLTLNSQIEKERACYESRHPQPPVPKNEKKEAPVRPDAVDWQTLVPY